MWRVFYSYSHEDSELRNRLSAHLAPLRHQQKIVEWSDREIKAGADWHTEISRQLESADLILLLISADFLASDYCFGVEVDKALSRKKRGEAEVVPILLRPCLWEESRFSELQIFPQDAKPITLRSSVDEAFKEVASEIRKIVSSPPPLASGKGAEPSQPHTLASSLDLVRRQVRSYARQYEKIRQRMSPSYERTERMEKVFQSMWSLATASYPLLDELAGSPSPGERLAAVAILQVFAAEEYLSFLVELIGSEKPFAGYHATKALQFAVGAIDPHCYPQLLESIRSAQVALHSAAIGFDADRNAVLREAAEELETTIRTLAAPGNEYE